jgi:magnesium-protoporphyrin IX monomethyl ester (oxidative) cyclase
MLGGANCEMETGFISLKNCPWVDFVVSGEADSLFPQLCRDIYEYGAEVPIERLPYGVYSRKKFFAALKDSDNGLRAIAETALEFDMDQVPIPDYSDYFDELKRTGLAQEFDPVLAQRFEPVLMIETSRGCWKGSQKPCTFCGLNGMKCTYRQKSPERVLEELRWLSETYSLREFKISDCIISMRYFKTLFKELARQEAPYVLSFVETISSLNEQHIKLLAEAGVTVIQPGIENLHDELLKLLNKGNSAIHNIALLKYALENGIVVRWNLLVDIPGDQDVYYQEMAEFLPLLYHLSPPHFVRIRFDRFSQYFERPEQFDLTLVPNQYYKHVYPFSQDDLTEFAYFWEDASYRNNGRTSLNKPWLKKIGVLVNKEWKEAFYNFSNVPKAELFISKIDERHMVIYDTRPCAISYECRLSGTEFFIYNACRQPMTRASLYQAVSCTCQDEPIDEDSFDQGLQQLIAKKLLLGINGRYLALATTKSKRECSFPPGRVDMFFADFIQKQQTIPQIQNNNVWEWFDSLASK